MKFKKGDVVYCSKYNVVAKIIDPILGEDLLLDEVNNPEAEVYLEETNCELATQEQIEACYNEPTTQWERLCSTPA